MFLTIFKRHTSEQNTERGSALVSVIGLMGVVAIIGILVSSVTVSAMGFTSSTRAAVQAQAAAEAGVDFVQASLASGTCQATFDPHVTPAFTATVYYSLQTVGDSWASGCPNGAPAQRIKIVSTGMAAAHGVAGNSSGNTRAVEAIYPAIVSNSLITGTGPAVYAYTSTGFSGSGTLLPVSGSLPSVRIKHGNVVCAGYSGVAGDLFAADGTLTMGGSCSVSGSVWASGALTVSGGGMTIGGDATASSMDLSGVHVKGNAWASGAVKVQWGTVIDGRATGGSINLAGGNIKGPVWTNGTAAFTVGGSHIDGSLTARALTGSGTVNGGTTIVPAGPGPGPAAAAPPIVPNWVDFTFAAADWVGFTVITLPAGACTWDQFKAANTTLSGAPGVIDARACTNSITLSTASEKLPVNNDLAIIGKTFSFGGSGGFSATSAHRLWLISPDTVADGQPTCPSGGGFTVGGGFTLDPLLSVMVYNPCHVDIVSGINWRGQVFTGNVTINGDAKLSYAPVGLPGYDLDTGTSTNAGAPGASMIGTQTSIRDVGVGG
jgi:type II secretory pathway pseudopilin PulG